ncbi:hypothetical protein QF028_000028 [Neobacillus sp. B4I6]|uniref:hypothetical protein n=1 Tax=Neobacillus sp. B4I6 TaxID=3373925 RepID=UPI003D2300DD
MVAHFVNILFLLNTYCCITNNFRKGLLGGKELLCKCPRNSCESLFFAVYEFDNHPHNFKDNDGNIQMVYVYKYSYPKGKTKIKFQEEIQDISQQFVDVYNQASIAEQEGLHLICGVGYRKALEHLIKDFIIS